MLKWLGRKEHVSYVGKLQEIWLIRAMRGGEAQGLYQADRRGFQEWPFLRLYSGGVQVDSCE
jgi:SLT domain-containing protein